MNGRETKVTTRTRASQPGQRGGVRVFASVDVMLTVEQVADWLGVARGFVYRLVHERRIRFVRVGRHVRIPESVVRAYIEAGTVEPTPRRRGQVA